MNMSIPDPIYSIIYIVRDNWLAQALLLLVLAFMGWKLFF
jgi:hypothetical protein